MKTILKSANLAGKKNVDYETNALFIERLVRLFEIMEKSNGWKSKYEYYQLANNVNEYSIIVSEI